MGFIGRKRSVDFTDTTLETFKKVIPYEFYNIRAQEKEIVIKDTVKIAFGGLDDQEAVNKFNSFESAFIGIDQAEETSRKDISVLQGSLRLTHNGKVPPYKQLFTANPAECWLKDQFIIGGDKSNIFIPALPDDNPYLPNNYKQTLREAFAYDQALLRAYLEGDWDAFSNLEDALVSPTALNKCRLKPSEDDEEFCTKVIAADVATKHGEAETVLVYRYGNTIKEVHRYKKITTTQIAAYIKRLYEEKGADVVVVDSDGFGEGVADVLESQRVYCSEFHGGYGYKPIDQRRYRNLRSQFYDIVAKKLEIQLISLANMDQEDFEMFRRQICSIKVKQPDPMARMQIESKEDMRSRQIMSPDVADAIVYSEYGMYVAQQSHMESYSYR